MLSREEAIQAYNDKTNQQISDKIERLAQLDTDARVAVANKANEILKMDPPVEILWNGMEATTVGNKMIYHFSAGGYAFIGYMGQEPPYGSEVIPEPSAVIEVQVADWATIEPSSTLLYRNRDFTSYGYRRVADAADFGLAILIQEIEAQMPNRLQSKNGEVNSEYIFTMGKRTTLQAYERVLTLYRAERLRKGTPVPPVVKPAKKPNRGWFIWN